MRMGSIQQGRLAEQLVLRLLHRSGWQLVSQRWFCRYGEIDLLLNKRTRLLLVEVKARRCRGLDDWGLRAFDQAKRLRLCRAMNCWSAAHPRFSEHTLEVVLALVPLPLHSRPLHQRTLRSRPVRWIRVETLCLSGCSC